MFKYLDPLNFKTAETIWPLIFLGYQIKKSNSNVSTKIISFFIMNEKKTLIGNLKAKFL